MEIVSIDVEDGGAKIQVAVADYFAAERLKKYLREAREALALVIELPST
jgi:hypothetical protein